MRNMLAAAGAALALIAAPAAAQEFEAQVRGYLDAGLAPHQALGYAPERGGREMIVPLRLGAAHIFPVQLRRGVNYRIYGACDQDCTDVDLEIYDPAGAWIERDIALDDTPYVQVTPPEGGRYLVRIWLAACEAEPCYVGARIVSGGTPQPRAETAAAPGADYVAHVRALLDQAGESFAAERFAPIQGGPEEEIAPLGLGQDGQRVAYQLRGGQAYRFAAACDQDCSDLDIEVVSASGRTLASNLALDNPTSLDFTPPSAGVYEVRIWLAACAAEPCFAGQRGFMRGAR